MTCYSWANIVTLTDYNNVKKHHPYNRRTGDAVECLQSASERRTHPKATRVMHSCVHQLDSFSEQNIFRGVQTIMILLHVLGCCMNWDFFFFVLLRTVGREEHSPITDIAHSAATRPTAAPKWDGYAILQPANRKCNGGSSNRTSGPGWENSWRCGSE